MPAFRAADLVFLPYGNGPLPAHHAKRRLSLAQRDPAPEFQRVNMLVDAGHRMQAGNFPDFSKSRRVSMLVDEAFDRLKNFDLPRGQCFAHRNTCLWFSGCGSLQKSRREQV